MVLFSILNYPEDKSTEGIINYVNKHFNLYTILSIDYVDIKDLNERYFKSSDYPDGAIRVSYASKYK